MAITVGTLQKIQQGQGGSYSKSKDALKAQVWDTRHFLSSPTDNSFFVQPIGSSWRVGTKTKNETNMTDTGKIPFGQDLLVERMGIALISHFDVGTTGATNQINSAFLAQSYVNILQSSVFEIKIQGREYDFQIHGRQFLPSLCVNGYNAGTAGSVARFGDSVASGWVKIDPNIYIGQQVGFSVNQFVLNADTTNVNASSKSLYNSFLWLNTYYCELQVTLEGFMTRAK
jgi:hypothetical protein